LSTAAAAAGSAAPRLLPAGAANVGEVQIRGPQVRCSSATTATRPRPPLRAFPGARSLSARRPPSCHSSTPAGSQGGERQDILRRALRGKLRAEAAAAAAPAVAPGS